MKNTALSTATSTANTQDLSNLISINIRDAAANAPADNITDLKVAAKHCVNISDIVRHSRNNKEIFEHLVDDACGLVYIILRRYKDVTEIQSHELDCIKGLLKTLASIERFAAKETSRNFFTRIIRQKSDRRKIREYRDILRQSLGIFGLESNLTIQGNIELFLSQEDELREKLRGQRDAPASGAGYMEETFSRGLEEQIGLSHGSEHQKCSVSENGFPPRTTAKAPRPIFPDIQSSHGNVTVTSVKGDHVITDTSHHISNINSGNTTTRMIMGLNNDSSIRF